ncbi:MAG TPA: hypothetical protein VHW96_10735 [Solirubrobacteraceae bacterium]|nr:hypothetical protein [Solirubrobacteraceae bacterium]
MSGCTTGGGLFTPESFNNMETAPNCPSELDLDVLSPPASQGAYAKWSTITPSPAIRIVGVTSTGVADCNLHSDGFSAFYFWGDNGTNFGVPQVTIDCNGATHQNGYAGSLSQHIQSSRYLGWQAQCNQSSCTPTGAGVIVFSVLAITLEAQETSGPTLDAEPANNLWYQSGWVRGAFPADLVATDPSGVCSVQTTVNGHPASSYTDPSPDTSQWMQCPNREIDANVDTTSYPDGAGAVTLIYSAANAAGALSTVSRAFNVDNVTPSVSLSAPADTASAAGDQTVTAVASGGPSGIAAIYCSVDGGATTTYDGATAQVPVDGIGSHQVSCYARNNAVNASGVTATSPTATLDLSVRQPTASAITFARIADALRCRTTVERVKVAGRVRTVRRHGKRVRVRGPARTVPRRVRKCHARTVVRTVRVVLKRHGRPVLRHGKPVTVKRRVRQVLLPHAVNEPARRVGHGKPTTVNGFVGLADGTALAGQTVDVYSSPEDNAPRFRVMRTVTTNASGEWTADVPAGPSRLIEAAYLGNATTEPASSSTVRLTVPARIAMHISPRVVPWSRKITISGRLVGGWVPRDGVALRLRVPYPRGHFLQEPFRTNSRGEFSFQWTYGSGRGVAFYRFLVATTATESDYPWAAAVSRAVGVTFGRSTPKTRRRHRPRHR